MNFATVTVISEEDQLRSNHFAPGQYSYIHLYAPDKRFYLFPLTKSIYYLGESLGYSGERRVGEEILVDGGVYRLACKHDL